MRYAFGVLLNGWQQKQQQQQEEEQQQAEVLAHAANVPKLDSWQGILAQLNAAYHEVLMGSWEAAAGHLNEARKDAELCPCLASWVWSEYSVLMAHAVAAAAKAPPPPAAAAAAAAAGNGGPQATSAASCRFAAHQKNKAAGVRCLVIAARAALAHAATSAEAPLQLPALTYSTAELAGRLQAPMAVMADDVVCRALERTLALLDSSQVMHRYIQLDLCILPEHVQTVVQLHAGTTLQMPVVARHCPLIIS